MRRERGSPRRICVVSVVNVKSKTCDVSCTHEGCKKIPVYNYEGKTKSFKFNNFVHKDHGVVGFFWI